MTTYIVHSHAPVAAAARGTSSLTPSGVDAPSTSALVRTPAVVHSPTTSLTTFGLGSSASPPPAETTVRASTVDRTDSRFRQSSLPLVPVMRPIESTPWQPLLECKECLNGCNSTYQGYRANYKSCEAIKSTIEYFSRIERPFALFFINHFSTII